MTKPTNFVERLKALRKRRGMSQAEFAQVLECDRSYLSQMETGAVPISKDFQLRIEILESQIQSSPEEPNSFLMVKPTKPNTALLDRKLVTTRLIPVISWARAGTAANFSDLQEQIDEYIESTCPDPQAFALIIEGDSMEPRFEAGDRVVFSPNTMPRNGDYVVARYKEDGGVVFKRFRRSGKEGSIVQLESLNPNYHMLECELSQFRFIYPAVDMKRALRR